MNALEKTGDALSQAATNAGKAAREEQYRSPTTNQGSNSNASIANNNDEEEDVAPSSEAAGRYAAEILARIDSAARRKSRSSSSALESSSSPPEHQNDDDETQQQQEQPTHHEFGLLKQQFQAGWQTVMESTTQSLQRATETTATRWQKAQQLTAQQWKQTQEKLRFEQEKLLSQARTTYYQRAISLPLDVEALRDAQVVYLTDRLLTLSHPAMASTTHGDISAERKLAAVGHLLQKRHDGRFMVWNLSEVEYNIDILQDQVLTYSFPGSPSPPLGLLLKLLMSMESWLKADPRNVAVVHCLTGKGRTSTVLAAFLCWMGEAGFLSRSADNDDESSTKNTMNMALEYIAQCKQTTVEELTIPSQRRYASYFKNMMDGIRPSQPPLLLKRIILSEAPRYAKGPPLHLNNNKTSASSNDKAEGTTTAAPSSSSTLDAETLRLGCAPYLQLFKSGQLLFTAPATLSHAKASQNEVVFCQVADGSVTFLLDQVVQGDILIRCRHLSSNSSNNSRQRPQRISMFRAAFHTGYVPPQGVMRLTKSQLDGACSDDRFPNDFFMDLIFEPAPESAAAIAAAAHEPEEDDETNGDGKTSEGTSSDVDAAAKRPTAHPVETSNTVTATTYDTMLHRDSRFWEVIDVRRKELAEKAAAVAAAGRLSSSSDAVESAASGEEGSSDPNKATAAYDPMWGPTIGRRRDFSKAKSKGKNATAPAASSRAEDSKYQKERAALQTFSIGGELDFLPEPVTPQAVPTVQPATKPRKKDSLMEALMGALDENYEEHDVESDGVEEIVFTEDAAVNVSPTIVELPPKKKETKQEEVKEAGASKEEVEGKGGVSREESNNHEAKASTSPKEDTKPVAPSQGDAVSTSSDMPSTEIDDILANANLELDENMEDLLGGDGGNTDELLDIDDAELEDLENFLSPSSKK